MQHSQRTRFLATLLSVIMLIGLLPTTAMAAEADTEQETNIITDGSSAPSADGVDELGEEEQAETVDIDAMPDEELLPYVCALSDDKLIVLIETLTAEQYQRIETLLEMLPMDNKTHTVFKNTESTLAPGVTQNIKYAYAADGKQMVYYIATADVTRDDVVVQSSYYKQHEGGVMGMAKLTEQAAYANQKYTDKNDPQYISDYYNVVAGVNSSFYNMSTGQPIGITYIDGVSFGTNSYDNFFAILKDGKTAVIDYASNLKNYVDEKGNSTIWQAAAGSAWLVRDGKDVTANASGSYNLDRHSRTCVGVTADGKVVLMVLDGRQEPFSCGGSFHELAQIMLEAGCVAAVNLDGGGSTTYAAKPEGMDTFQVLNRPSDGSERAISAGIIVASTALPSDTFEKAILTAENDYVTPESTVNVSAVGVSPAGTSAEIPADITWQMKDAAMGSMKDGVFTANKTTGNAVVQMVYGGKVVGETTIHVVHPEIAFTTPNMTVPHGKTFALEVVATTNNGNNAVVLKDGDVTFAVSDPKMGTISGKHYTPCDETASITGGQLIATYTYDNSKTASANVTFGKASVIVEDFEDGKINGWEAMSGYKGNSEKANVTFGRFEKANVAVVTAENGKVRNGEYALAFTSDFTGTTASGYRTTKVTFPAIDLTGATAFGMWMYIPVDDVQNMEFDIGGYEFYPEDRGLAEDGWYYIRGKATSVGSSISSFKIFVTDPDETYANIFDKFTIYIDDLTIDYSNATEDREIPQFTGVEINTGLDHFAEMNGQTINTNTVTVKATAQDDPSGNFTGLDNGSARVYVDGVALKGSKYSCEDGVITVPNMELSDGTHTFRFEISDNNGNLGFVTKQIVVAEETGDVAVVRRASEQVQPLAGSLVYFDVVAQNAEKIKSIKLTLDLDMLSEWELEGSEIAHGFTMKYSQDETTHTAYITLTASEEADVSGEAVIASLPVRVWQTSSYKNQEYINAGVVDDNGNENKIIYTPVGMWQGDHARFNRIEMNAESIVVKYTDGDKDTFSQKQINVITEYNRYRRAGYYKEDGTYVTGDTTFVMQSKNSTHVHNESAPKDVAATCNTAAFKGQTYCKDCGSVVEWGVRVNEPVGHNYEMVDGVVKCTNLKDVHQEASTQLCGAAFTGVWTDGREYKNGVLVASSDGWVGESYYQDGKKLTGIHKVPAPDAAGEFYYDFGDDGISKGKYTGLFYDEAVSAYRYAQIGELSAGWKQIADEWYYFRGDTMAAATGRYPYDNIYYIFEDNGRLTSGVWATYDEGVRYFYGPTYYRAWGDNIVWATIDGGTYCFDKNGYRLLGLRVIHESNDFEGKLYDLTEDGQATLVSTIYNDYLYIEGIRQKCYQLVFFNDDFYFVNDSHKIAKNTKLYLSDRFVSDKTFPDGTPVAVGLYEFDDEGRMIVKNGPEGDYFYKYGIKQSRYQLVEFEDEFYFINDGDKLAKNTKLYLSERFVDGKTFADGTPVAVGLYEFDADGKMILN